MKKTLAISVFVILLAVAFATAQQQTRSLTGTVTNDNDQPVPNAIVYLKNTKTLAIKTFIAQQDGTYRFHALSPNVDYEVYAELNGKRSESKTLSSFDSRPNARINLKLE